MKKRIPANSKSYNISLIKDGKNLKEPTKVDRDENLFQNLLLVATFFISFGALLFFVASGQKHLADYDALARLNIARKMIDSITPGVAQLGGIWLPFPQVLFLPFIKSNFLWHSGLAGAFPSMAAFIASAFFLYKTVFLITKERVAGLLAWLVYVTNINIIYLQTMAMSESFFLFTLIMIMYFLTKWVKSNNLIDLIYAAIFVVLTTLTRYEGYALFGAAALSVAAISAVRYMKENIKKVEGTLVMFVTLAGFGIALWSFYSLLIYKDPIYWLNLYSGNKDVISIDPTQVSVDFPADTVLQSNRRLSLLNSFKVYGSAMLFTNGVLITILAFGGFCYLLFKGVFDSARGRLKLETLPIILMTMVIFVFLIFGYFKGFIPNVETPLFTFANLFDKSKNFVASSNIRYGLIVLPLIALVVGMVYGRLRLLAGLAITVIAFQIFTLMATPMFLTFSLPRKSNYEQFESAAWFADNYDDGLVLVSAHRHENFMFQTGLNYDKFIYEGSRQWWKNSLEDPTKHATWVVVNEDQPGDAVAELMTDKTKLYENFEVVWEDERGVKIYKLKK